MLVVSFTRRKADFIRSSKRKFVIGEEDYVRTMIRAYRNITARFSVLNIVSDLEKGIAIAELELPSIRSVDVFEFENGLIWRERKYYYHILC